jgi:hypothetical protein
MGFWTISGNVTAPSEAEGVLIRYIGSANSGSSTTAASNGDFSFDYDDNNGILFYMIFELLDEFGDAMPNYQPIIHGPYIAPNVGTGI